MQLSDILDYYSQQLIYQYRLKSKAKSTIRLLANQAVCDGLVQEEQSCFDLDTAMGAQLTILGNIVGVPRNVYGLDLGHVYFSFTRYLTSEASIGFGRYNEQPDTDVWLRYASYGIYTLIDFELRALIRLKIIFNTTYSSFKELKEKIYAVFGNDINIAESPVGRDTSGFTYFNFTRYSGVPASNGFGRYSDDPYLYYWYRFAYSGLMQLTYTVKSIYINAIAAAVFLNIMPHPCAVKVNVVYN